MSSISSIGVLFSSTSVLLSEQSNLSSLSTQLASHKKYTSLTEYTTADTGRLLNFQSAITQKQGYINSMQTVSSRLDIYDSTLTDLEKIAQDANTLSSTNQNYDPTKLSSLQAQITSYLSQVGGDLNQKLGDRYLFSGTRYNTKPVTDLTALLATAPSATPVSNPALPDYDANYVNSSSTNANAYTQDTVTVDQGYNITYGITSTDPAFQKLISGLRFMYKATQDTTSAAYQSDMTTAAGLLANSLNSIQTIHASLANNQNTLTSETAKLNTSITSLKDQISNIQSSDLTEVSAEINLLQTQLSASYSATATVLQLSILKFL